MYDKKRLMDYVGGDNVLIISPSNTYYISGYESSFAYILLTEDEDYYITDSRYTFEAKSKIKGMTVLESNPRDIYDLILSLVDSSKALYYDEDISYYEYMNLNDYLDELDLIPLGDIILKMRAVKSEYEIECITKAQNIAEKAFTKLLSEIKVGMTELETTALLEYYMKSMGGDRLSFDTIVASGVNGASPHAHPSNKQLAPHEFVTIDFGTTVCGYHGDMTRTFSIGEPTDEMRKVYEIVKDAQSKARDAAMAGKVCSDIDKIARDHIASYGYGKAFGHSLGHSVGIDIHEAPTFSPACSEILLPNMCITDEPGIYLDDKFGVRIEDILIIKDNHNIDINNLTRELIIL